MDTVSPDGQRLRGRRSRRRFSQGRYRATSLIRHGLTGAGWRPAWRPHTLRSSYDVVVIGGGVHGLATAYELAARHGIRRVAVLDRGYLGGGGSGRNTAIVRSNYLTPEGVRFYDRALARYRDLARELNFNVMFSRRGHLTLAHSDSALRTMRWRAEVNKHCGVDSEVLDPAAVAHLVPALDVSQRPRFPVLGALYHPPGGIVRHDAVVWGYARAADAHGVHLHQNTEVTGIEVADGRVRAVITPRGRIATGAVVNCTAGWASTVAAMAGVRLPITTHPLQAAVTEPVRPFLHPVLVSGTLHVYVSQTDRGELVFGGATDPFASYSMRGSLGFAEDLAAHVLELLPSLGRLRLLRQWAGLCDVTPDFSPIMGLSPVEGFYLDVGWGTYGFKAAPAAGEAMATCVATGVPPPLIAPFGLDRFERGRLVGERGAAAVGH